MLGSTQYQYLLIPKFQATQFGLLAFLDNL
jgi:hypothetical protein